MSGSEEVGTHTGRAEGGRLAGRALVGTGHTDSGKVAEVLELGKAPRSRRLKLSEVRCVARETVPVGVAGVAVVGTLQTLLGVSRFVVPHRTGFGVTEVVCTEEVPIDAVVAQCLRLTTRTAFRTFDRDCGEVVEVAVHSHTAVSGVGEHSEVSGLITGETLPTLFAAIAVVGTPFASISRTLVESVRRTGFVAHVPTQKVATAASRTEGGRLTVRAACGTEGTRIGEVLVVSGHRHTSESLIVEDSVVFGFVAARALPVLITVVAVIGTHRTGKRRTALDHPRLADAFAGAQDGEVVPRNAGSADLIVETHRTLLLTLRCHSGLVIVVARKHEASVSIRKEPPLVCSGVAGQTLPLGSARETVIGT